MQSGIQQEIHSALYEGPCRQKGILSAQGHYIMQSRYETSWRYCCKSTINYQPHFLSLFFKNINYINRKIKTRKQHEYENFIFYSISKSKNQQLIIFDSDFHDYLNIDIYDQLFSATAGLSDEGVQLLTKERERYSRALFLYCMANRGLLGPAHYAAVLSLVDMIEHQTKRQKDMHLLLRIELPNRCRVQLIEEVMD